MLVKINYCYQCGRPVGSQAIKCLYCAAPTRRIIRPERRCPYCDEPIRHKAVKCVHCGEFLDGRPREEKALHAKNAQPTFIIEKAIISPQGISGTPQMQALPGAGGGNPRGLLEAGGGQPRQPMQALPAPINPEDEDDPLPTVGEMPPATPLSGGFTQVTDDSVMDVEGSPSGGNLPAVARRDLAPNRPAAPAPYQGSGTPAVAPMPPVLVAIITFVKNLFRRRGTVADDTLNVASRSEEDNYRTCMMCQTEILMADSYCYHCGQQYAVKPFGWGSNASKNEPQKSNAFIYVLIVASLFGYAACENLIASFRPEAVKPLLAAFAAAAPLLSFFAFMRKPGFMSRLTAFLFLIGSLAVIVYFLPDAFRGQQ